MTQPGRDDLTPSPTILHVGDGLDGKRYARRGAYPRRPVLAGVALAAAEVIAACGVRMVDPAARPTPPASDDLVPRIDVGSAHAQWRAGTAVLLDTRGKTSYDTGHPAGALSMPLSEVEADAALARKRVAPGKLAIFYCT